MPSCAGCIRPARSTARRPAEAYQVRCDRGTMTQNDIDNGRVIAIVQFNAAAPIDTITVVLIGERGRARRRSSKRGGMSESTTMSTKISSLPGTCFASRWISTGLDAAARRRTGRTVRRQASPCRCAAARSRSAPAWRPPWKPKVIKEGGRNYGVVQRVRTGDVRDRDAKARMTSHARPVQVVRTGRQRLVRVPAGGDHHHVRPFGQRACFAGSSKRRFR